MQARVATRVSEWFDTDEGKAVPVDAPDSISIAGCLVSGAEVSVQIAAVPVGATGARLEIYGREGMLMLASNGALSGGPNRILGVQGRGAEDRRHPYFWAAFIQSGDWRGMQAQPANSK